MMKFSDLSTVEEALGHQYVSAIGSKSTSVSLIEDFRDSDGNICDGFAIEWDSGRTSWLTYWEGEYITVLEADK